MSADQFTNFAITTLAGGGSGPGGALLPGDTTAVVVAGTGALFPATSAGTFRALLIAPGNLTEIVICTARTTDTFTLTRAQEGTTAPTSWPIGTTVLHNITAGNMTNLWNQVGLLGNNPLSYGAVGNNPAHDDTAGVNAALAVGTTVIPPGVTFYISAPLTMTVAGSELFGLGRGTSQIKQMATFSGAALITISADFCSVRDLTLLGSSSSSSGASVAATGITLAGARYCSLRNLEGYYLNGYLIEAAVTGTVTNQGAIIEDIHLLHCNGGIHVLSSAALNNIGQVWMSNLNLEIADGPLDAVLIEEANDIQISNYGGAAGQGSNTNSALHIKGSCASVTVLNPDIGVFPGPASAPTMLVESTVNGAPSRITVMGGVIQAGTYCVQATNGTNFLMSGVQFRAWTVIGLSLELAGAMYASIVGCEFSSASTTGSSGRYDLNIASSSARVTVANCIFRDTIGTGAGQVNASLNTAGGRVYLLGNDFEGATLANAFQGGVLPGLLVNNANINPAGSVSVTVGASPYSVPTKPYPVTYYISGGTVTSLAVGGVTLTGITSGPIRVPPQTAFTITHSGAPTVVGFGD